MKKLKYLLFSVICMGCFSLIVSAAPSYSFNVSSASIENGKSVTASVTIRNAGSWHIKIISSGNTYGCSNEWSGENENGENGTKTFSTTCKASSLGTIAFTLSGDITDTSYSTINLSGSKSVNVREPAPASTINTLKKIEVEGYELTPEFSDDIFEYSVEVPSTVDKVKINTTKKDSKSSVEGDGEKEVVEGSNKFEIIVTAESGAKQTYVVIVNVKDNNPINVSVNGINYTIVKNSKNLEIPEGYVEEKITIDGVEVPAFKNELNNITLIALKDESGNTYFFKYNDGKYTKYISLQSNLNIFPQDIDSIPYKGFTKTTINIDGNEIVAFKYKDLNKYYIIYGMDLNTGNSTYYLYDVNNKTFQVFDEELFNELSNDSFYLYMLIGAGVLLLICIILVIWLGISKNKIIKRIKGLKKEEKNE